MRVLQLSYEFPPLGGGGSKVVQGLAAELVRQGLEVDVLTMHYPGLPHREELEGVRVFRVPCVRLSPAICTTPEMLSYGWSALRALLRFDPARYDLNHTHFIYPDGVVSMLLRRHTGLPFVVTAHGSDVPGFNPDRFRRLHRVSGPLWRHVTRAAESIVCPSASMRGLVLQSGGQKRTEIIPNGFGLDRLLPDRPSQERLLVVSRLFKRKGVQHLLRALSRQERRFELHVVGDGPYLPELRRLAAELGLAPVFWGWLDHRSDRLRELYASSRIFVLPSESENFPIVLLEAMAAGHAIITTAGTGCAEVVGDTAVLVEPADVPGLTRALDRLTADPATCRDLGRRARLRLEREFGWPAVARRYIRLYERHARTR